MRRLVYCVAATLDGFIAGPDGGDPSGQDFFPVTPGPRRVHRRALPRDAARTGPGGHGHHR